MNDPLLDLIHGAPVAQPQTMPQSAFASDSDPLLTLIHGDVPPNSRPPIKFTDDSANYDPSKPSDPGVMQINVRGLTTDTPNAPPAPTAAAPDDSMLGQIGHQLGLTARAGVTGLTSLPNMVGDALNSGINLGTSASNKYLGTNIPKMGLPSQSTQNLMDMGGFSTPRNGIEQGVQAAASAVAGVSPSVQLGKLLAQSGAPVAQAIGAGMQATPGTQMLGSAGAGGASSAAAQNGAGALGQLAAGVLGAVAGTGAAGAGRAIAGRITKPTTPQQYAQALRDQANNAAPNALTDAKPRLKLNVDGTMQEVPVQTTSTAGSLSPPSMAPVGALTSQRQLENIEAMRKVGVSEQRQGAISGDKHQAGVEYEESKLTNPRGAVMRAQLQKEQDALKEFSTKTIHDTGANASSPEAIGQSIRTPMQGLSDHFDSAIGALYDRAKVIAGRSAPVKPQNLNALLGDNDFRESFLSSPAGTTLIGAIDRQVKRFQGIPTAGETLPPTPNTINSAENLRKWLNSQWSPGNSKLIGQVKEALDSDVGNAGGAGIFNDARALHALRKNTLDNPNGIAKLLTSDGPNGINQAIPDEQVAPKLLSMPTGQFEHIVTTLKNLPGPLQEQGRQALAEIKGALARKIHAAGDSGGTQNGVSVWNAANVTRELNAQRSKMAIVFNHDEMQKFSDLHTAGHVLQTPMAYKGAVAQGYNLLQSGAINGSAVLGTGAGSLLGLIHPLLGTAGATIGSVLGAGASKAVKSGVEAQRAVALAEALRNPVPSFPK